MPTSIITLTTDFGVGGWFAGAMKGVVLGISPGATLIDISHSVPPQDIAHGAFVLGNAYRQFPRGSVHVAVVDPGVGTARQPILLVTPAGHFVAPDNGLLTYVLLDHGVDYRAGADSPDFAAPLVADVPEGCSAYVLTKQEYWRHPVSDTFHGRDIFAPVAANLSLGVPPREFGEPVHRVAVLNVFPPVHGGGSIEGHVIFVDPFGNLVSNVPSSFLDGGDVLVEIGGAVIAGLSRTFADSDGLLALTGSHGYLEIAERNGNAARRLEIGIGGEIRIVLSATGPPKNS
jgi:S-adenosylmethionine hydrolase